MRRFDTLLDQLRLAVEDIRTSTEFYLKAKEIVRYGDKLFPIASYDGHTREEVLKFLRFKSEVSSTLLQAQYCALFSQWEGFFRDTTGKIVEYMSENVVNYDGLRPKIQNANFRYSGNILTQIDTIPRERQLDIRKLCSNLANCFPGSQKVSLNVDAFVFRVRSGNLHQVNDIMGDFGYEPQQLWDELGRCPDLQKFLGETSPRKTGTKGWEMLKTIAETRNKLVHRDVGLPVITPTQVDEAANFIAYLGATFTRTVKKFCTSTAHPPGVRS